MNANHVNQEEVNARVRRILMNQIKARIADGDAVRIPYDIDKKDTSIETLLPPDPSNIQSELSLSGDIACGEWGLCPLDPLVPNAVLLYNSEYFTKHQFERESSPRQNGMATMLFDVKMNCAVYGTVIVAPATKWD